MRTALIAGMCLALSAGGVEGRAAGQTENRTWTDVTGHHRLEAHLVSVSNDRVRLAAADGRMFSIALDQLSPGDRQLALGQDAKSPPGNLPPPDEAGVLRSQTAAMQSAPPGGPSARQNPAPLPLDMPAQNLMPAAPGQGAAGLGSSSLGQGALGQGGLGQMGATPSESAAGGQRSGDPGKDKRIFSGGRSNFHLDSRDGTGAYWIGGKHYLARLTWFRTEGNYVYFTSSGEGGVHAWAFFDVQAGCGGNRVFAWTRGAKSWQRFDDDYRELPN
ncbi:MAG TPA: SHD1 domain-containing protein [Pirellulales bacterium]|jgi:hypothetical protein|nr:SHD1 domain-containing protein [Pirellulales bacterium]